LQSTKRIADQCQSLCKAENVQETLNFYFFCELFCSKFDLWTL